MDRTKQSELMELIESYVSRHHLVPPLSLQELHDCAAQLGVDADYYGVSTEWIIIMINNALWQDTVASIPAERRLFLLPRCMKSSQKCRAMTDELGLICEQCGSCKVGGLTAEAEARGMMCIVAEGGPVARGVIQSGAADAIIGVSCLESLRKAFPHMVNNALPGIAIPLDKDGCVDTRVDVALVRQYLRLESQKKMPQMLNAPEWEKRVKSYFTDEGLLRLMGEPRSAPESLSRQYLMGGGKRFRPFLCAAVYLCLSGAEELPEFVQQIAVAIECFHKASLIHDDIEDDDSERDGLATLHCTEGLAIALNCGDLLLGEGYRLIAEIQTAEDAPIDRGALLRTASRGHLALCRGQGDELALLRGGELYGVAQVLEIFKGKTAPAFEVALVMGAVCAQADPALCELLSAYSESFGVAYQIYDDLGDFHAEKDAQLGRLSVFFALAHEANPEYQSITDLLPQMDVTAIRAQAEELYEHYRQESYRCLQQLTNPELKRLLFRITTRILKDV